MLSPYLQMRVLAWGLNGKKILRQSNSVLCSSEVFLVSTSTPSDVKARNTALIIQWRLITQSSTWGRKRARGRDYYAFISYSLLELISSVTKTDSRSRRVYLQVSAHDKGWKRTLKWIQIIHWLIFTNNSKVDLLGKVFTPIKGFKNDFNFFDRWWRLRLIQLQML